MSLENLKSAFSNIVIPQPTLEKQGKSVNDLEPTLEKQGVSTDKSRPTLEKQGKSVSDLTAGAGNTQFTTPDVSPDVQSNLTSMVSEFSIQNPPQQVDYQNNEKAPGFTARFMTPPSLFTGIEGESPNLTFSGNTLGYTDMDTEWPGPINFLSDQKATGFTLDQLHKSPSRFVGVEGQTPDMTWNNNPSLGGSIYGIEVNPQEVNNILDTNALGFTANLEHKSPTQFVSPDKITFVDAVDFIGNTNSYYSPVFPEINGFTLNYNKGGYDFGRGDVGNSHFIGVNTGAHTAYHNSGITFTNQSTDGNSFLPDDDALGFTANIEELLKQGQWSQFVGINFEATENQWENPTTDLYSNNGVTFGGAVDFLDGVNSYYNGVNTPENPLGIPGFTNDFTTGGYTFGADDKGNSHYIEFDTINNLMIPTGTHTRPLNDGTSDTVTFSDTPMIGEGDPSDFPGIPNPLDGTWNTGVDANGNPISVTSYYDSIHTVNPITDQMYGPVDFLGGNNSYYGGVNIQVDANNEEIATGIPGFTNNFTQGGYSFSDGLYGNSKYLTYADSDENPDTPDISDGGFIDTGTHSRPLRDGLNTFIDFPGNKVSPPNFPGGFSSETPLGDSIFVEDVLGDDNQPTGEYQMRSTTYFDYYGSDLTPGLGSFTDESFNDLFANSQIELRSGVTANINKGSNKGGESSPQFSTLYDMAVHQQGAKDAKYGGPVQDGSNINTLERFNLKSDLWQYSGTRNGKGSTIELFSLGSLTDVKVDDEYGRNTEPYIVTNPNTSPTPWWDSDTVVPKTNLEKDVVRISKFLSSYKGDEFTSKMLLMGQFQTYQTIYDPGSTLANVATPKRGNMIPLINIRKDYGILGALVDIAMASTYSEYLDYRKDKKNAATGILQENKFGKKTYAERDKFDHLPLGALGYNTVNNLADKVVDFLFPTDAVAGTEGTTSIPAEKAGIKPDSGIDSISNMQNVMSDKGFPTGISRKGDRHTLMLPTPGEKSPTFEQHEGMPFYFKDLRDDSFLVFRAYIEGLSETISPNWEAVSYVGRSEPVYTYSNAEREVQFTLKLFAQTKDELNAIYHKINRLTSLCYPQYKQDFLMGDTDYDPATATDDTVIEGVGRARMKPPLTKMRMGDLYGTEEVDGTRVDPIEVLGFIKSLSYSFPDNSPWEIEKGKTVPKYIEVSMGYQIIHSTVPNLEFAVKQETNQSSFYGINKQLFTAQSGGQSDGASNSSNGT
tara:strand:- start:2325 stop:6011 length:3687 start_codon:yes stop_codon:yes gene_type:complete